MIILTIIKITTKENLGHPKAFDITGVPTLFGVCVYSFMCQHSLPSLITPIRNKSYLSRLMVADYSVILVFYFLLCLTAIFAFDNAHLMDMYTLNFQVRMISLILFVKINFTAKAHFCAAPDVM